MSDEGCLILGAGPAGIGVALCLQRSGVRFLVLERDSVAASWRHRYDRLRLNTSSWLSHLPGSRFPRDAAGSLHATRSSSTSRPRPDH